MRVYRFLAIVLLFVFSPISVHAHDNEPLFNQVNLQAQAEREIPNNQLTVVLAVEEEGKDAAKIANKVNQDMDWALKVAAQ